MAIRADEAIGDLERTLAALSESGEDALSKADGEGYPNWEEAVEWTERIKDAVLHERDRAALRSTLDALRGRFLSVMS